MIPKSKLQTFYSQASITKFQILNYNFKILILHSQNQLKQQPQQKQQQQRKQQQQQKQQKQQQQPLSNYLLAHLAVKFISARGDSHGPLRRGSPPGRRRWPWDIFSDPLHFDIEAAKRAKIQTPKRSTHVTLSPSLRGQKSAVRSSSTLRTAFWSPIMSRSYG